MLVCSLLERPLDPVCEEQRGGVSIIRLKRGPSDRSVLFAKSKEGVWTDILTVTSLGTIK